LTQKKQKVKAVEIAFNNLPLRQSHQEFKAELPSITSAPSLAAGKLLRT
jgi:flagellar basal body P-ring protein FlgI